MQTACESLQGLTESKQRENYTPQYKDYSVRWRRVQVDSVRSFNNLGAIGARHAPFGAKLDEKGGVGK